MYAAARKWSFVKNNDGVKANENLDNKSVENTTLYRENFV